MFSKVLALFYLLLFIAYMTKKKLEALIQERQEILEWLDTAKAREMELRIAISAALFQAPKEGVNRLNTADNHIKYDHKLNYTVDETCVAKILLKMPEHLRDTLIKVKYTLSKSVYNTLPKHLQKIFNQALIIKPGTPSLTITKHTDEDEE
jgi:hypothetical protein